MSLQPRSTGPEDTIIASPKLPVTYHIVTKNAAMGIQMKK